MSQNELPSLPNYSEIRELLDVERATIIKVNGFADDSDDYVRTLEDAALVLDFVESLQKKLHEFLSEYPSLISVFNFEYVSFYEFVGRGNVLDLIFLDDCLFPEKESVYFGQDGGLSIDIMQMHEKSFINWMNIKRKIHTDTEKDILENFDLEMKAKDLGCQCISCIANYRTRLRETIFDDADQSINETVALITDSLNSNIEDIADHYQMLQKKFDKIFYKYRYKLKRSSLNRLESQIKTKMKSVFNYPSPLALDHARNITPELRSWLLYKEFSEDLITDDEYHKFYRGLHSNFWRGKKYLEKEFKKFVKAIVVFKKKDVSSKILNDYLGEFWIHSSARELKRKIIYHMGPTNSGKTYHAIEALSKASSGCYLAPLRLLAGELYDTLNSKGAKTSLLTGEEVVETEGATHFSSTIEMAKFSETFACCVIDEIQMITDSQRGWAWTRALVNMSAPEVHICGDPSALDLVRKITELCGDELIIKDYTRMTELIVEPKPIVVGQLNKSDALIVFSRRNALKFKRDLERVGFKVSIVYGRLSPEVRREQARKFDTGETDIIVSTDAISMGMNLPIKRIVFSTLIKFYDGKEHPITASEIKQIAGRAGRYKRYPTGYVTCLTKVEGGIADIEEAITEELDQSVKCMVGPDLDIFAQVNTALDENNLPSLKLSEFLRLFNTMDFKKPFYCVELKEMIELAEIVEDADPEGNLSTSEIFGFTCAPVNLGILEHVQYYMWILKHYVSASPILNEKIDDGSNDIDYLETSIKCVELYQWLSRHFKKKNFSFDEADLLNNKGKAVDKLNELLSNKIVPTCSSCGCKLTPEHKFAICEDCFKQGHFRRRQGHSSGAPAGARRSKASSGGGFKGRSKKRKFTSTSKSKNTKFKK